MASTVKIRRTFCLYLIINCISDKKCACTCVCSFPYQGTLVQKHILHQNWRKKAFPFGACNLGKVNLLSQAILHFASLFRINQKKATAQGAISTNNQNHHVFHFFLSFMPSPHSSPPSPPAQTGLPASSLTSQIPVCSPCVEPSARKQQLLSSSLSSSLPTHKPCLWQRSGCCC